MNFPLLPLEPVPPGWVLLRGKVGERRGIKGGDEMMQGERK